MSCRFFSGEVNFDVMILKSKTHRIGHRILLRFRILQHERDLKLMELLIKYLGTGKIEKDPRNPVVFLTIYKISDITTKIIPFFEQNPLLGVKQFDYFDWRKIANLMNLGKHLTIDGLDLIRTIKAKMNTGRKFK